MLSKKQIESLKPAPFQPVFRTRRKKVKTIFGSYSWIEEKIPVMEYDPHTGKKVQKMERGYYTTTQLNKMFLDQKRNKTIEELFTGIKMTL